MSDKATSEIPLGGLIYMFNHKPFLCWIFLLVQLPRLLSSKPKSTNSCLSFLPCRLINVQASRKNRWSVQSGTVCGLKYNGRRLKRDFLSQPVLSRLAILPHFTKYVLGWNYAPLPKTRISGIDLPVLSRLSAFAMQIISNNSISYRTWRY